MLVLNDGPGRRRRRGEREVLEAERHEWRGVERANEH